MTSNILPWLVIAVAVVCFNTTCGQKIEFRDELKPGESIFVNKTVTEYVNSEGSENHDQPIVTTESIKRELYAGPESKPRSSIFQKRAKNEIRNFHHANNDDDEDVYVPRPRPKSVLDMRTDDSKPAVVSDPSLPILVEYRIAIFWGSDHLPSPNGTHCVKLRAANKNATVSFCDIESKIKCVRDPSPVFNRGPHPNREYAQSWPEDRVLKVVLPDGKIVSELAWFCPAHSRCCEWECCVEKYMVGEVIAPMEQRMDLGKLIVIVALISIMVMLIIMAPFFRCAYTGRLRSRTEPIEYLNERGQLELLQRTSSYPKQPRESWSRNVSVSMAARSSNTIFIKENEENENIEQNQSTR